MKIDTRKLTLFRNLASSSIHTIKLWLLLIDIYAKAAIQRRNTHNNRNLGQFYEHNGSKS